MATTTPTATAQKSKKSSKSKSRKNSRKSTQSRGGDEKMLKQLFSNGLKDMYWAEKALVKALGQMAEAASSSELQQAFEEHKQQTQEQAEKLEQVFETIGETARAKKCEAMEGLIKEGKEIIEETEDDTCTRDCGLIMAAQKVEHYEIASYGGLAQIARTLGEDEAAEILEDILQEEKETDMILTEIAETSVNQQAGQEGDYEEEEYGYGQYSSRGRGQSQGQGRSYGGQNWRQSSYGSGRGRGWYGDSEDYGDYDNRGRGQRRYSMNQQRRRAA